MKMSSPIVCLVAIALVVSLGNIVRADVKLPKVISDHMVLQKSDKTAVWGWATPGEDVTVTLDTQSTSAKADAEGKWKVRLDLSKSAQGPFELTVAGKNKIVVSDVLVGQVWVASGQSNMELPLSATLGATEEIANCTNPLLRQYHVIGALKPYPPLEDNQNGVWRLTDPTSAATLTYSAVAYYFGKKLQHELKVPVGIIQPTVGGTCIEQWMSSEGFDPDPELKLAKDTSIQTLANFTDQRKKYPELLTQWINQTNRQDKPTAQPADFAGMDIPTTDWTPITLPGTVAGPGLPTAGAFWLRKEITLSATLAGPPNGKALELIYFAGANDFDTVYWNGQKVIQYIPKDRNVPTLYLYRRIYIPKALLKEGRNVLAIRFYSPIQAPQVTGNKLVGPNEITIGFDPVDSYHWLAKAEYALPALDSAGLAAVPVDPSIAFHPIFDKYSYQATQLYNGHINPITPYTIAGFLWYQGENNVVRAYQYRKTFQLMIKDWRAKWGLGDTPFYFCQLAAFAGTFKDPTESSWAELREAQSMALQLPNTGQAVLIDIGEGPTIHPRDKKDVGERLALIALANNYHENIPFSGPVYESSKVENDKIRILFKYTDGGLVAKPLGEVEKPYYLADPAKTPPLPPNPNSQLQGFAICGDDHKWVWADAAIDGTTVIVSSPIVPHPVAVRYAWAGFPICNLFNGADLPASPFRTDDFPLTTVNRGYGQ